MTPVPAKVVSGSLTGAAAALAPTRLGERLAQLGLLQPERIPKLLDSQQRWGCRFGEAMIAEGVITPIELAKTLADGFGLPFVDLTSDPPDPSLCNAAELSLYLKELFLPWRVKGGAPVIACVDPSPRMRALAIGLYGPRAQLAVTGKFDFLRTVQRLFREHLSHEASFHLDEREPQYSARRVATRAQIFLGIGLLVVVASFAIAAPALTVTFMLLLLCLCYVANIVLRVVLFVAAGSRATGRKVSRQRIAALDERRLPVYSIIAPLYREAHMVAPLVAALKKLSYPAAKLDIKLVLEEDDAETIAAAKALRLDGRFEILCVPSSPLRTKPRACNYALNFVRGDYVVVYDAEDRPEPDQLKKVVVAFRAARRDVACFQARLNVYNANDNWLTRMFALEYAAWFDFLLPGLNRLGIPIPLGGTSNHFRTEILRQVFGWDAFNVTEDADLGLRLAQQDYRAILIDSSTFEEAIPSTSGWIKQRSRWLKGYMQTALVHLRRPIAFIRAVGIWRFWGFVLFVCGAIATSLFGPLVWCLSIVLALNGSEGVLGPYDAVVLQMSDISLIAGNGLLILLAMAGPLKRRWLYLAPYGATVFLYWLLISVAAYKALWQLNRRPHHWEKTQHGVARTRLGTRHHFWRP